jgi:hypothetical protein
LGNFLLNLGERKKKLMNLFKHHGFEHKNCIKDMHIPHNIYLEEVPHADNEKQNKTTQTDNRSLVALKPILWLWT